MASDLAPLVLGVEIGGTKLQVALGDRDGWPVVVVRHRVQPEAGAEAIRRQIAESLDRLLASQSASRRDVQAAGFGFGGPVDWHKGVCVASHHVHGWDRFPLVEWSLSELGVARAVVRNDSDAAALAEATRGAGHGCSPLLYVNSGSGIGGGLVIDGRIYDGNGLGAIEIGHLVVEDSPDAPPRTVESLASGWAIEREAADRLGPDGIDALVRQFAPAGGKLTAELVATAALNANEPCRDVIRRATRTLGRALAHAVTLLAPRRVVLGGGVSLMAPELWLGPIRSEVDRRVFPAFRGTFEIVPTALGEAVVLQGALLLAAGLASGADP